MRLIDADAFLADLKEYHDYIMQDPEVGKPMKWREAVCFGNTVNVLVKQPTIEATPVVHGHCGWCKPGEELCGTCRKFFDYHGDGGSDKCSSDCMSDKCAYYEPIGFCPNCGAKMDGEKDG